MIKDVEVEEEEEGGGGWKFFYFLFLSEKRLVFSHNNKTTTVQPSVEVEYGRNIKKVTETFGRDTACFVTCYCVFMCVCLCGLVCAWLYVCAFILHLHRSCGIVFFRSGMLSVMKFPTQGELLQRTCLRCVLSTPLRSDTIVISIISHTAHTHAPIVAHYLLSKYFNIFYPDM